MPANDTKIRHRKSAEDARVPAASAEKAKKKLNGKKIISHNDLLLKATGSRTHRVWIRSVVIASVMILAYFYGKNPKEVKFAPLKENIILRVQKVPCSEKYKAEMNDFPRCVPTTCGRLVTDTLIDAKEADILLQIAKKGFEFGQSTGGASILDLHSGALSKGKHFVNIYGIPEAKDIFRPEQLITYKLVKSKIKAAIAERFQIDVDSMHLTYPTFFSRITNETAKTIHDEYWHPHIDKDTYESFHYTSLLYLSDYEVNFKGGRFFFIDGTDENNNKTVSIVEPKKGRLSAFTSGQENLHNVEVVTYGERFAVTISFTCDPKFAIDDPKFGFVPEVVKSSMASKD